jgi:hypothetical protein
MEHEFIGNAIITIIEVLRQTDQFSLKKNMPMYLSAVIQDLTLCHAHTEPTHKSPCIAHLHCN